MGDEIKTLISAKCQHLPEPLQDYLDDVFLHFVEKKDPHEVSISIFKSILSNVEFLFELEEKDGYILGINYNPSSFSISSIPTWKIIWKKECDERKVNQIDEILEWIFESHSKLIAKSDLPKFYSGCHEKKVVFTGLNGHSIFLPVQDIIYLTAEGDFTRVFYGHGKGLQSILADLSMRCAENMMEPFSFYRIHRSYMVNLGCIRKMDTTNSLPKIMLCCGTELPIARRRKIALFDQLNRLS